MSEVGVILAERDVAATLDGRKRCVRFVVRPQPETGYLSHFAGRVFETDRGEVVVAPCAVGDVVWVRERFANMNYDEDPSGPCWTYKAGTPPTSAEGWVLPPGVEWRAPQSMPRAAARLFLRVVSVRGERIQKIGELGARMEGFERDGSRLGLSYAGAGTWVSRGHPNYARGLPPSARAEFASYWDGRHRDGHRFADDPWVFVVGYERGER